MNLIKKNKNLFLSILLFMTIILLGHIASASRPKKVNIITDTHITTIETEKKNVKEVLEEQGISLEDKLISPKLTEIVYNDLNIKINTKKNITFKNKDKLLTVTTYANTVKNFLKENNVKIDENDIVLPSLDSLIKDNDVVTFDDIEVKKSMKIDFIPFKIKKEFSQNLKFGEIKIIKKGKRGLLGSEYTKTIKNGKEIDNKISRKLTLKNPKTQTEIVGTKEVVKETIKAKLVEKANDSMYVGETKVIKEGNNGSKEVTYNNNGKKRKLVKEVIIKKANDKIVEYGTKSYSKLKNSTYSLSDFEFHGVIYWGGYKFTYYSEQVLPGGGLYIPGRHINEGGYVADGDGYIVLANDDPIGTIIDTPFGYQGKVYDRGTSGNHYDVYTR